MKIKEALSGAKEKAFSRFRGLSRKNFLFIVSLLFGACVVIFFSVRRLLGSSLSDSEIESEEALGGGSKRREGASAQDEKEWLAEEKARHRNFLRSEEERVRAELAGVHGQLMQNQEEAKANQARYNDLFSVSKASYDDALTSFEDNNDLSVSFMLKEDLDAKKGDMLKLGEELKEQHNYLIEDYKSLTATLKSLEQARADGVE